MPALDGIRAFAVLAVITYHTGVHWMQGGFYGVDVFLVLSGFLITSLLVGEWGRRGTVSLSGFWVRRARRLLPALFLMLAGVALVAGVWPAVLSAPHLMSDAVATILYVANWHLAVEHASYFAAVNQPSPLLHTWTLAIEEQFYLVWPLVVVAVMRRARRRSAAAGGDPAEGTRRGLRRLLAVACAGASASAVWMVVLAPTDGSDPSRAYYGSDTRAQGLLVGAALAIACALWGPVRTRAGARVTAAVGLLGAAGVALMWVLVPETDGFAFHGGFLLITLACGAVVVAAARVPRSAVGRVLALAPLRYLGQISYGMYLWYWPVLLVMTGARTGLHGYPLTVARLAVVTGLAALSFHLVETPVRRGALAGWRGVLAAPTAPGWRPRPCPPWGPPLSRPRRAPARRGRRRCRSSWRPPRPPRRRRARAWRPRPPPGRSAPAAPPPPPGPGPVRRRRRGHRRPGAAPVSRACPPLPEPPPPADGRCGYCSSVTRWRARSAWAWPTPPPATAPRW
jgi:peptidoglycan/LPS O-acetylase OafA/YrhL